MAGIKVFEVLADIDGDGPACDGTQVFRFRSLGDALLFSRRSTCYGRPAKVHVWTTEDDDTRFLACLPPSVCADLEGWIAFQRSYAALRAEGKSDVEAHRFAVRS